jgi:hypothetical protein
MAVLNKDGLHHIGLNYSHAEAMLREIDAA